MKANSLREATTIKRLLKLRRDNLTVENGWLMAAEDSVTIANELTDTLVSLPRHIFNRLIDFYQREQKAL